MRHRFILLLTTLFCLLPTMAQKDTQNEVVFFARVVPERDPLWAGDSCLVSVILYSSHSFAGVEKKPEQISIKGGNARLLPKSTSLMPFRAQTEEGIFNAIVWQQYVVGRDEVGKIRFSTPTFKATFVVVETNNDPFERFFGFGQRNQRLVKAECKPQTFTLSVTERPKRSSQDIIKSGAPLI